MILIDTDVAIDVLRGHLPALEWFRSTNEAEWLISGYAAMEILHGCRDATELRKADTLLNKLELAWLDAKSQQDAYQTYRQLHLGNAVGIIDIMIAQTAISLNLPLHTFNQKHFSAIPNLVTVRTYTR